jgi:uncharacterized membrane protein
MFTGRNGTRPSTPFATSSRVAPSPRPLFASPMAPSGPWSANKRVLMLHSSVATFIGFALIFAPAYLSAIGPAFVESAAQQALFGGIFVLLGGLFCTVPETPAVLKCVMTTAAAAAPRKNAREALTSLPPLPLPIAGPSPWASAPLSSPSRGRTART